MERGEHAAVGGEGGRYVALDARILAFADLAGKLIEGIFKALFGDFQARLTLKLVKFLVVVAHPIVTNHGAYGTLNDYGVYVTVGAWGCSHSCS